MGTLIVSLAVPKFKNLPSTINTVDHRLFCRWYFIMSLYYVRDIHDRFVHDNAGITALAPVQPG